MSPVPNPFAAKFPGKCVGCERRYPVGTPIERTEQGYAHEACADAIKARAVILAGETFRGHKPSEWRVGGRARARRGEVQ